MDAHVQDSLFVESERQDESPAGRDEAAAAGRDVAEPSGGKVEIGIDCMPFFNYSLAHVFPTPVRGLVIDNGSPYDIRNLLIRIDSATDLLTDCDIVVDAVSAGQAVEVDCAQVRVDAQKVLQITEMVTDQLNFKFIIDDEVVFEDTFDIQFFAFDQWLGPIAPDSLAAFATPNHPALAQVIVNASRYLKKWTGDPSFDGYQSGDPARARVQAAALFRAVQDWSIVYVGAPASFTAGQRIRMPDAVLEQHMGTCLDFTVLYAALAEAVGLRPLMVIIEGHAFPGVWLEEASFPEPLEPDVASLAKRCAKGVEQITVFQSTDMCQGTDVSFERAETTGRELLRQGFAAAVDVHRARTAGILPLPVRVMGSTGWTVEASENEISRAHAPRQSTVSKAFIDAADEQKTKKQLWERSLLDLSMHNNLLNMRFGRRAMPIFIPALDEVEDTLARSEDLFIAPWPESYPAIPEKEAFNAIDIGPDLKAGLYAEFKDGRLRTAFSAAALKRNLDNLYRSAKSSLEETGASTLFLALGMLKWVDAKRGKQVRLAPLMLFPVDIVRKSAKSGYVIRLRDDEPQVNISLVEMLRADYGISVNGLDPLPLDEAGVDTRLVLNTFVNKVMDQEGWEVLETACIGLFSFSQFVMWNDIHGHADELRRSKVVDSMMEGHLTWTPSMPDPAERLDPSQLLLPAEADASQLYAVRAAVAGNTFVLHGPPGTGKSQTITVIIANALARGQKVLFVAEKMAALEVVEKRLAALGLAPFCLEVHSTKATKNHVLEQIQAASEVAAPAGDGRYALKLDEVRGLRERLDRYAAGLQETGNAGLTLREAISAYISFDDACVPMEVGRGFVDALAGPADFSEKMNLAERLIATARPMAPLSEHPLQGVTGTSFSNNAMEALPGLLDGAHAAFESLHAAAGPLAESLQRPLPQSRGDYAALADVARQVRALGELDAAWLGAIAAPMVLRQLNDLVEASGAMARRTEALLSAHRETFLDLDVAAMRAAWEGAQAKGVFKRGKAMNAVVSRVSSYCREPIDATQVDRVLSELEDYRRARADFERMVEAASPYLAPFRLFDGSFDWDAAKSRLQLAAGLDDAARGLARTLAALPADSARAGLCRAYASAWTAAEDAQGRLAGAIGAFAIDGGDWAQETMRLCDAVAANRGLLHDWMIWNQSVERARAAHLDALIDELVARPVTDGTLDAFRRGVYRALCVAGIDATAGMNDFSTARFEETVRQYVRADAQLRELARDEVYYEVASRLPDLTGLSVKSTGAARLQKALRSRGRNVSIRSVLAESGDVVRSLCPCFLMSPLSVAQYLEPGKQEFDLIIFDEASQLQTCKAVGALSRAKNAVIVGDPRQMPPTSFFQGKVEGEDYEEVSDLESVLEDCLALNMPQTYLQWHYRSQHESLIAFSNKRFYESKMYTFPSADDRESRVTFVPVEGYFDRGGKRVNEAEARAVVDELRRRAASPALRGHSVGVVTFNIPQQLLIEDLLQEACSADPGLDAWATGGEEPLFVKNLENVQGDERDVILFSVTYAPDKAGKMSMNFGPINREGGWRRLNVAVTRARMAMCVFSSMRPEDIDLNRTSSQGPASLKAFLAYAQRGGSGVLNAEDMREGESRDAIALALCRRLAAAGYETTRNVGRSAYKVDVAVADPGRPGRYLAGILLDGTSYALAQTTRDREVSQPLLLERLGWHVMRLWALEWWEDADAATCRVLRFLDDAREEAGEGVPAPEPPAAPVHAAAAEAAPAAAPEPAPISQPEPAQAPEAPPEPELEPASEPELEPAPESELQPEPTPAAAPGPELGAAPAPAPAPEPTPEPAPEPGEGSLREPYRRASIAPRELAGGEFADIPDDELADLVVQIIASEAPIEQSLLVKGMASCYGIGRVGSKVQAKCELAIKRAPCRKSVQDGRTFIWRRDQDPKGYLAYRVSDDDAQRRDYFQLPFEEIIAAGVDALLSDGPMKQEDLVKQAAARLGYKRVTAKMTDFTKKAVTLGIRRGYLKRDGADLRLGDAAPVSDDDAAPVAVT